MTNKKQAIPINRKNIFPFDKPQGKNSVRSLSVLFEDRKYYSDFILPYIETYLDRNGLFGDLVKQNSLYGLVDTDMNVVAPYSIFLEEIPSSDKEKKYALDFVAVAFKEMNEYLMKAASIGKFSKTSPFYNLKAYRAHESEKKILDANRNMWSYSYAEYLLNDLEESSTVRNAASFNTSFLKYVRNKVKSGKTITKTATILSSNFSSFMGGLIIDIAKDKADDDTVKFDKYLTDKEFSTFADACKRFGFLIDANQPWRLIADVSSPAMIGKHGNHTGYMTRKQIADVNDLFVKYFYKTYLHEIQYLKDLFFNAYQKLVEDYPFYDLDPKKLDICDFKKAVSAPRAKTTKEQYLSLFDDKYWMRVYTYLRNYEELRGFKQQEFENVVREANNFVSVGKQDEAIKYVNNYFKQFKNAYFLSSLLTVQEVVEQKAESKQVPDLIF